MRGPDIQQDTLFSRVSPETRMPIDHPLRPIRRMIDEALEALGGDFAALVLDVRTRRHPIGEAAHRDGLDRQGGGGLARKSGALEVTHESVFVIRILDRCHVLQVGERELRI